MKTILVTGSNGQLGLSLKEIATNHPQFKFIFTNKDSLDISNSLNVVAFFEKNNIDYCINCAAYTNVDKAETQQEVAHKINVIGVKNIAKSCNHHNTTLIHISTDFVFDGNKKTPYTEEDTPNPQSVYGKTKLLGEKEVEKNCKKHYIIRTSWLYSQHGSNFMKTMLQLAKTKKEIRVVEDQIGTPTYALDLANAILHIINSTKNEFGVYHYSNQGEASWYDFAKAIFKEKKLKIKTEPIKTNQYATLAKRPKNSVLNKNKIKENFSISIFAWQDSLKQVVKNQHS